MDLNRHYEELKARLALRQQKYAELEQEMERVRAAINAALGALRFCELLLEEQAETEPEAKRENST